MSFQVEVPTVRLVPLVQAGPVYVLTCSLRPWRGALLTRSWSQMWPPRLSSMHLPPRLTTPAAFEVLVHPLTEFRRRQFKQRPAIIRTWLDAFFVGLRLSPLNVEHEFLRGHR